MKKDKETKNKLKKMLTNTWNYDKVNKLSTNSKSVEKRFEKT